MADGRAIPGLRLPTHRSQVSSALSGYSEGTERMDELAKVILAICERHLCEQHLLLFVNIKITFISHLPCDMSWTKVKKELEEALRQVKMEMREGGASKSQTGLSTSRSRSVLSEVRAPPI